MCLFCIYWHGFVADPVYRYNAKNVNGTLTGTKWKNILLRLRLIIVLIGYIRKKFLYVYINIFIFVNVLHCFRYI